MNNENQFKSQILTEELSVAIEALIQSVISNSDLYLFENTEAPILKYVSYEKNDLPKLIKNSKISIYFKTSGTTGEPKIIKQKITNLTRSVKFNDELSEAVWGFCYSARHISGILLILQALLTKRPIVDLRNKSSNAVGEIISKNKISHISAPASFYRLIFPLKDQCTSVLKVTNGGEPLDSNVVERIKSSLPNAQIRNIYASTEFGSLLVSHDDVFSIPERLSTKVKIIQNNIYIHRELLSESVETIEEWYNSNDVVEMITENKFVIKGRQTEDVKILGHLVSLRKVEKCLNEIDGIAMSKVEVKNHSVFGQLLIANVVMELNSIFDKKQIKDSLKRQLRGYEIPSKIKKVNELKFTSSGKMSRI